jgi:hypothetical protein
MRIPYDLAVTNLDLLESLSPFDPIVIGTPPLGIDVADSDIDIACSCDNLKRFEHFASHRFQFQNDFRTRHATFQNVESVIVQFRAFEWDVEIFCQPIPTNQQWGVRHFRIEQRLLAISPNLKSTVIDLKRSGLKTEPAFAKALGLSGDPYVAILGLEKLDDRELLELTVAK